MHSFFYMWRRLSLASIVIQLFVCSGNALPQQTVGTAVGTKIHRATQKTGDSESRIAAPDLIIGPPINGLRAHDLYDSFNELHYGHRHEAIDIMEPEGTPIRAVVDGTIRKLFLSKTGGKTIYEFDEGRSYCYYYAHLRQYAYGLREGMRVSRGEVIGYVGSTGDASSAAPHLHFAVFQLGPERRWWKGIPIDPYPVLERSLSLASRPSSSRPAFTSIYLILEMLHAAS